MPIEREVKLRVHSLTEFLSRNQELKAVQIQAREFEDNYVLDFADQGLRREGKLLRLRTYGEETVLTFKGPVDSVGQVKSREEIEMVIGSLEPWLDFLGRLGIRRMFRYQKYRTIYAIRESILGGGLQNEGEDRLLKIMIDETPIGNFVELEGEEDLIRAAAVRLGWQPSDFILTNYRELYLEECRDRGILPGDMVFEA